MTATLTQKQRGHYRTALEDRVRKKRDSLFGKGRGKQSLSDLSPQLQQTF